MALATHFDHIERSDLATRAVFPDHTSAQAYLASFDGDDSWQSLRGDGSGVSLAF